MSKNMSQNSSDQWLIKSAGRVLGPFKLTEVVSGLQLKHFTVMDEISMPFGRWVLIRDEVALQEVLKYLRQSDDNYDSTLTMTSTAASGTKTGHYEIVTDPQQPSKGAQSPPPFPFDRNGKMKLAGHDPLLRAQMRKKALVRNSILGIVLLVIVVGVWILISKSKFGGPSDEVTMQFNNYKNQGLYERALDVLNKAKLIDKNNLEIDTEVALIQIGFYNQTVAYRRILEKALNKVDDKNNGAALLTAIGLTYILEGDWKNAGEQFQKALTKNPQFQEALFNKGALDFRSGQFEKSEKDFEPVIPSNPNDAYVILGSALSSLEVARKGVMPVRIMPVLNQMLEDYLKNNTDMEQEILLIQAYIYTQLNKTKERQQIIQKMLSGDLDSGKFHKVDLLQDRGFVSWKQLISYCQSVYEVSQSDAFHKAIWSYCLYRSGNDLEAKKMISEVSAQQPQDPIISHVKAYLYLKFGMDPEAKAALGIALKDSQVKGAMVLKGKLCEKENNDTCVSEVYNQLLELEPRSLPAYLGLAKLEFKKGNKKGALEWVNRGQAVSSTYLPLWELKNTINSK